jgi:hypothetical protein
MAAIGKRNDHFSRPLVNSFALTQQNEEIRGFEARFANDKMHRRGIAAEAEQR